MGQSTMEDGEQRDVSGTVVELVADAAGISPMEVDPLYSAVDPDALEQLFSAVPSSDRAEGRVTFALHGHLVTVHADGRVELEADGARNP